MSPSEAKRAKGKKMLNAQNQRRHRNSNRRRSESTSSSETSSIDTSSSNGSSSDSQSSQSSGSSPECVTPVPRKVRKKTVKNKIDLTKKSKKEAVANTAGTAKTQSLPKTKRGTIETTFREQKQRSEEAAAAAAAMERYNGLRELDLQTRQEQQQKQKEQERRETKKAKLKLKKKKDQEQQQQKKPTNQQLEENEHEQQSTRGTPVGPSNVTSPITIAAHAQNTPKNPHPPPTGTNTNPTLAVLAAALSQQQQHTRGITPQTQQQHVAAAAQLIGYETMYTPTADGGLVAYLIPKVGTSTNNASRPPAGGPNTPIQLSAQQRASLMAAISQTQSQHQQNNVQQRLIQQLQQQQLIQQLFPGGILNNSAAANPLLARQNPQLILTAAAAANPGLAAALLGGNNLASLLGGNNNQNQNAASTAALLASLAAAANQNQRRQSEQQQQPAPPQPQQPRRNHKTDERKDRSSLIDLTADDEDEDGRDFSKTDDQSTNSSTSSRKSSELTKRNEKKRKAIPPSVMRPGATEEQVSKSPETRKRNKRKGNDSQEESFHNSGSKKQSTKKVNRDEDDQDGIDDSETGNDHEPSRNTNPYFQSGIVGVEGDPFGALHTQQLMAAAAIAAAKQRPIADNQNSPTLNPVSRRAQASKKSPSVTGTDNPMTYKFNLKDDTFSSQEGTEGKEVTIKATDKRTNSEKGAENVAERMVENNKNETEVKSKKGESKNFLDGDDNYTSKYEYFGNESSNRSKVNWMSQVLLRQGTLPLSESKAMGNVINLTPKELIQLSKTLQASLESQPATSKLSLFTTTKDKSRSKSDLTVAAGTTIKANVKTRTSTTEDSGSRERGPQLMSLKELSAQNSRQIQMIREAERAQFHKTTQTLQRLIDNNQDVLEKQEKKIQELLREMRISGQQHKESAALTKHNIDSIAQLQQRIQDEECLAANDSRIRNQQPFPNEKPNDSEPKNINNSSKTDSKTVAYEEKVKTYRKQIKKLKDQIIEERNRVELSLRSYMRASVRSLEELRAE